MEGFDIRKLTAILHNVIEDTPAFETYAIEWYERYKRQKIRPKTRRLYEGFLKNHLVPFFGKLKIGEIKSQDVQNFYDSCNMLSHSTVRQMKVVLHQIFESAKEDQYIEINPTESTRHILPAKASERSALSQAEIQDVIRQLPRLREQDSLLMHLLIYTGERRGEVLGLRWEDIDFDNNVINISRQIIHLSNHPYECEPKSKAGIRAIPLLPELKKILQQYKKKKGFIIGDGVNPITETSFNRRYERIGRLVDLHGATPHIFRHTFLTMASDKLDPKTLQAIAGHATFSLTFNKYVHKRDEKVIESVGRLAKLFT